MNLTTAVSEGVEQGRTPEGDRRRRRRLLPAAVTAALLVAVAVGLAARPDGVRTRQVASESEARPATTAVPEPAATPAADKAGASTVPAGPRATSAPRPATAPKPVVAPDRSRPAGMTYEPQAVWPETLAELDRLQAAVDQGREPWRNDPVEVARAYLRDRGLPAPGLAPFRAGGAGAGDVEYTSAGRGGTVNLQRLLAGSIWYVASSRTALLPGVTVVRTGDSLVIEVQSGAEGTITARAKRPGGGWGAEQSRPVFAGGHGSVTLGSGEMFGEFILQLRLDAGGGRVGVADAYLPASAEGFRYSAVDAESRLRVDGLGPVRVGMTLDEARASGLPLVTTEGLYCVGYRSDGPPTGLALLGVESSYKVDFIEVSEPTLSTVSGIRVGSTEGDVRRAYGDRLRGSVQDGRGRLVFRAEDASLADYALSLQFSDGKVVAMAAGLRSAVEADEACA